MTTQNLLEEWLETDAKEHVKIRTYSRYRSLVDLHIAPVLGAWDIADLGWRDIQALLRQQAQYGNLCDGASLSASSANMMLSVLNLAFEYACSMNYLEENPCSRVKRIKGDVKKIEAFTLTEQRAIEAEIIKSKDRRLNGILLCLYTGMRIGELLGLTWSDIDLDDGKIAENKTVYREKD